MGNAGKVSLILKGDYNAATTYQRLNVVYYQGRSYVCKQTSTGNVPTNTTYWQAMTANFSDKMDATNPTGTGSFSLNRKASTTVGNYSFAEGTDCTASGYGSHAEGLGVTASGVGSHAEGNYTIAGYNFQHVCGRNNDNKAATLFEVGNGAFPEEPSNAFEVYSDGTLSTDNGTTKVKLETLVSENQALTNEVNTMNNVLGAKNLLPNGIQSQVTGGVTITRNADGSLTFEQTGTASSTTLNLFNDSSNPIKLTNPCKMTSGAMNGTTELIATVDGTDYRCGTNTTEVSLPAGNLTRVRYFFNSSFTGTLTLKPMIRDASIADDSYQPYAKTNVELTQELPQIESGTTAFTDGNEKVNFSKAFSTAPNVIAIPKYTTVTTGETPLLLKVYDVTTTYFRVRAIDNTGANVSTFTNATSFIWQAMT